MPKISIVLVLAAALLVVGPACGNGDDDVGCNPPDCEANVAPVPECDGDGVCSSLPDSCDGQVAYCFEGCVLWRPCRDADAAPAGAGMGARAGADR